MSYVIRNSCLAHLITTDFVIIKYLLVYHSTLLNSMDVKFVQVPVFSLFSFNENIS
jgi:hypothetical protein